MFVHGDIMHILFNMLILILIGSPFESRVGRTNFAIIYFTAGIAGALLFSAFNLGAFTFLIGASGAIFGILGAFAVLYPRDEVTMFLGFIILPRVPVIFVAVGLGLLETMYVTAGVSFGVAHLAHIGGLVSGIFMAPLIVRRRRLGRKRELNYAGLAQFATTLHQRDMLARVQFETEEDVRKVWLQHFLESVYCPRCGRKPEIKNNKIVCCDYEIPLYKNKK
jgi:membrane associated rhomboid family serine protease